MSWNFTSIGKCDDVAAQVSAMEYVPQLLKDLLSLRARGASTSQEGLNVVTYGHQKADGSIESLHLEIDTIFLAPPAPVALVEPPPQPERLLGQA